MDHDRTERRKMERSFEKLSPFELKNELIRLGRGRDKKSTRVLLDAGRGNPNWIAATPREAFFALGQFAVQESRLVWNEQDLAGKPARPGMYERFQTYVNEHAQVPGMQLLKDVVVYGITHQGFVPDEWVYELVDGIVGDNYPVPDRMLIGIEQVVHEFLMQELCECNPSTGTFDLFAVEGATAAMCYVFDTLAENYLLNRGDKIAVMVPIFPPYIEIPHLARYDFDIVEIKATATDKDGKHTWQYPASEIDKLRDPSIQALFLVNPSNPPSVAIQPESIGQIVDIVTHHNPNLMIISDDVYGTFVDDFCSLMTHLPHNTIGVYSLSKYFGVTGWRLGVVAVHKNNVFEERLRQLPSHQVENLNERYSSLSQHPAEIPFIERMVAESRQVALRHTAGLSTPQQVQMAIFCAFALIDKENRYKELTKEICQRRMKLLYDGLQLQRPNLPYDADYYTQFDLEEWSNRHFGREFTHYLKENYEPIDVLFRLAEQSSIVLLNGRGFHGPTWSIRVSLANLDDDAYARIGQELHQTLRQYVSEWKEATGK